MALALKRCGVSITCEPSRDANVFAEVVSSVREGVEILIHLTRSTQSRAGDRVAKPPTRPCSPRSFLSASASLSSPDRCLSLRLSYVAHSFSSSVASLASTLDTSLTNFLAFMLGSLAILPAVEYFCLYAGTAILFDFILQVKLRATSSKRRRDRT